MGQAAGKQHSQQAAALQRHLEQLQVTTPQQQQQLTLAALCQGVAARDPAWVDVLVQVLRSAPRAIQQQLAAQPGLLKDLAGYLADTHPSSSGPAEAQQHPPAAGHPVGGFDTKGSNPTLPTISDCTRQQQQRDDSNSLAGHSTPHRGPKQYEQAAAVLALLLDCCGSCAPPPPYQDLAPVLHAALQQRLVCLPPLAQAVLRHHASHMVADQQLLGSVMEAADQGQGPAAAVLALLAPKVLQLLEHTHPAFTQVHERVTDLLGAGTAAGGDFLAAAVLQGGNLLGFPGMLEAASWGLSAASPLAGAPEQQHEVHLQYFRRLVDAVLHVTTLPGPALSGATTELFGHLAGDLFMRLELLLGSPEPHALGSKHHRLPADTYQPQRPYHDAAWSALLRLSECPQTVDLVRAVFQKRPGLLQALAASWDQLPDIKYCEEPADTAARLAAALLLSGTVPGQQERRQHKQLLVAAVRLWDMVWPDLWWEQEQQLLELIRLLHGPAAVAAAPNLLEGIFQGDLLSDGDLWLEGWDLLLAAPAFVAEVVDGVAHGGDAVLVVVEGVFEQEVPAFTRALLAMPGLGDALVRCCSIEGEYCVVDDILGYALACQDMQAYLAQQPVLLQALVARLRAEKGDASFFWESLPRKDDDDDGEYLWLVQQPALLDATVHGLVMPDSSFFGWPGVVEQLLEVDPSLVCVSLLRQPPVLEQLLRALARRCCHPQPANSDSFDEVNSQLLLLERLADTGLAPRVLELLPGLLAQGDAELSAGVFEAMHLIQRGMEPGSLTWGDELAATSGRGAAVLCAEEQLAALQQGAEGVWRATAAAAAATRQLQERHTAMLAGVAQPAAQIQLPGRGRRGSRRLDSHGGQGGQQQGQHGAAPQQVGNSSQSKGKRKAAAGPQAAAGSQGGAGGCLTPSKGSPALGAASDGVGVEGAGVPPTRKRSRR